MTCKGSSGFSSSRLSRFFADHGGYIVVARVSAITAPATRHPRDILPSCRRIVIFAKVLPDRFFSGTAREKKAEVKNLTDILE